MRNAGRAMILATLSSLGISLLTAQPPLGIRLAQDAIESAIALEAQPSLATWRSAHSQEHVDPAHYEDYKDSYQIDFARLNQWCAESVAQPERGFRRAVSFFVPEVTAGALPPLPARADPALTASCKLGAVWYQADGVNESAQVMKELTSKWGAPVTLPRVELLKTLSVRGSGYWKDVATWRRGSITVFAAWKDWEGLSTIVWMVRDRPRDFNLLEAGFDTTTAAVRMAGLGPRPQCDTLNPTKTADSLSRWLRDAGPLAATKHAAALLVADSLASCVQAVETVHQSLVAAGAKFEPGCPQDGPDYAHNFRDQAEAIDPRGSGGALAALTALQSPCALKGPGTSWPDRVVIQGKQMLLEYPAQPWTPWVHFWIARGHDLKLAFSIPPGEADVEVVHTLTNAESRNERAAAIAEFEEFIRAQPNAPEAVFAWQEAWRLKAGLPASQTNFGCGCE